MTHWTCHRCGDCCRRPEAVALTLLELAALERAAGRRLPVMFARADLVHIPGHPCPLAGRDAKGRATCEAYAARPYNCRRYMCGRASCDEPWDPEPVPPRVLFSRELRRDYTLNQRRAQRWAREHGWKEKSATPRARRESEEGSGSS